MAHLLILITVKIKTSNTLQIHSKPQTFNPAEHNLVLSNELNLADEHTNADAELIAVAEEGSEQSVDH